MTYYLVLDVGTTTVKAFAYSPNEEILKKVEKSAPVRFPSPGWVEQDPEKLWEMVRDVIMEIYNEFGKPLAVGLANQRASTIVWDRSTGEPLYNMITWQDTRAIDIAEKYNKQLLLKFARTLGKTISLVVKHSRNKRILYLLTLANFKLGPNQPIIHLKWLFENIEDIYKRAKNGELAFGTIDSWIIWKMIGIHATDYTNASATGLFDPFFMKWSDRLTKMLGIPKSILPKLIDNMGYFGEITILDGAPLTAVIADQQASLFSAGGLRKGTVKMTNGTGTFIDINVGETPQPARLGTYPLVALKVGKTVRYLLEGIIQSTGSAIDWLVSIGLIKSPEEASIKAEKSVSEDTIFIPALAGLGTPYWNPNAKGLIYGITRATKKEDVIKALLEGIAFRCSEVIKILEEITKIEIKEIIADGNASRNDYMLQAIADFSGKRIIRVKNLEGTSRGVFLLTKGGLEKREIKNIHKKPEIEKIFEPKKEKQLSKWHKAMSIIKKL
ncbi:MAG: FGGY family carbohydrate kinase [Candidatus Njordarchaeales archaeon]